MGSYMNFKTFGEMPHSEGSAKLAGNLPLVRQSSIYCLTFDEFQNTLGGFGKDFGSMNMDELLKNIWTAEETQAMTTSSVGGEGSTSNGNLQRQGSLTLPRTLSQKTVDEVWRDLIKESSGAKDGSTDGGSHLQKRQPTLGEMTLEEFLARAGVVREDAQQIGMTSNGGFYGELSQANNNTSCLSLGLQQLAPTNVVLANQITDNNNAVPDQSRSLPQNVSGVRSSQQQQEQQQQQQRYQQHLQPLFPKQATVNFAASIPLANNAQLANSGARGPIIGMADHSINNALVHGSVVQNGSRGMAGLVTGATIVPAGSPASNLSPDSVAKNNADTLSLSPPSFILSEGARGRRSGGTLEKAMERRHRRMIKNRESAARSRARKQAYTLELEAEVAKLKEINEELQKKQEEIMVMQKNQNLEKINLPWGNKRRCLRRTLTGPW